MTTLNHKEACRAWLDGKTVQYSAFYGQAWKDLGSYEDHEGVIPICFAYDNYSFRIRPEASKEVAGTSPQPQPVSTVMPEAIEKLISHVETSALITGFHISATHILALEAIPHIRSAYQRIADLEKELLEIRPTPWAYEQACKALEAHKKELTQLKSQLAEMREAGDDLYNTVEEAHGRYKQSELTAWEDAMNASNNQEPRPMLEREPSQNSSPSPRPVIAPKPSQE